MGDLQIIARQQKRKAAKSLEALDNDGQGSVAKERVKLKGLRRQQVSKAASALLKHIAVQQASSPSLIEDDELLYLTIALEKTPQGGRKDKPIRLQIPHPIWQFEGSEICLFVKDLKGEGHKAAKAHVRDKRLAGVSKVVGLSKLKTKYEAPEAKRQLCNSFDLFLADERILPLLPKALGKTFFRKKKQPVPVDLQDRDWGGQVRKACDATYMYRPSGNSLTVRIARGSFTAEQTQENVLAALSQAIGHVPKQWKGIRAVFLKTADSVALPLYQRAPAVKEPSKIDS